MGVNLIERLTAESYLLEKHLEHLEDGRPAGTSDCSITLVESEDLVERLERQVRDLTLRADRLRRERRPSRDLDALYAELVSGIR